MERVVHKAKGFAEAAEWDIQQHISMTPQQRIRVARALQRKAYRSPIKDVRQWRKKS